jgi:hypothetical protein
MFLGSRPDAEVKIITPWGVLVSANTKLEAPNVREKIHQSIDLTRIDYAPMRRSIKSLNAP